MMDRPLVPYYWVDLKTAGIVTGCVMVGVYAFMFFNKAWAERVLPKLPRNKFLGIILLAVCLVWTYFVISVVHLGEFYTLRKYLQIALPFFFVLIIVFVDEFLTARATGILLLLAATVLLDSAFMKVPVSRLLLVVLAYIMVIKGLIFVGKPYIFRDAINRFVGLSGGAWKLASAVGLIYGVLILFFALKNW